MRTSRVVPSIRSLGVLATLLSLLAVTPAFGAGGAARAQAAASGGQATDLQAQLETILRAAKDPNSPQFGGLFANFKLPANANWFAANFGEGIGAKLAAAYETTWSGYSGMLPNLFTTLAADGHHEVAVKGFASTASTIDDRFVDEVFQNVTSPVTFYTATSAGKHGEESLPGIWVYVQGAFRVINLATFYGLPEVEPPQIRIPATESQEMLVHQVNPVQPTGLPKGHGQGVVILHVLVGTDGVIKQVEVLEGTPELSAAAVNAVQQWRYKPPMLNGDPVEAEINLAITFTGK
ncbi:MAG TPA: energy transducer TonB [Candidatus Limnocylindrales bacterium]|nr:energy transducer TonB [Candidatus Limnocylindrales bacterium]